MRRWIQLPFLILLLTIAGCTTKAKSNAQAKAAFIAGQKQALAAQAQSTSVWIVGNVKTSQIPWTADLTLSKALIIADYQGPGDPGQITVFRSGQPAIRVAPNQLLQGEDIPLQGGDRIDLRP
jgi:hypothetical protein